MTNEKLNAVLSILENWLDQGDDPDYVDDTKMMVPDDRDEALNHCLAMVFDAQTWGPERLSQKTYDLGFIQGVCWAVGVSSLSEFKKMNTP